MSVVTNVMLNVSPLDEAAESTVAGWSVPAYTPYDQRLSRLDELDGWGGSKFPEVDLFGGAFNHLRLDDFMAFLAALPWQYPDEVQLFVHGQEDYKWTVYELDDGSWCRLVKERP